MLAIEDYNGKEKNDFAFDDDLKADKKEWYKGIELDGRFIPIKDVGSHKIKKYDFGVFAITQDDKGD